MSGIYIHIPFCKQACHYCNFHFSTLNLHRDKMAGALAQEIELRKDYLRDTVSTIYFGGGTPSILPVKDVETILTKINDVFTVGEDPEITLETNPDDITIEKLLAWKSIGINRLSIGIQSFFDEDLRWMNRAHNAGHSLQCIEWAQQTGFSNITIDLIYGGPTLSDERWKYNVDKAISLGIPHLSCYALTVESKTALSKLIEKHKVDEVDPAKQSVHFELLMLWMREAGYEHYEISNFAKPGYRSRHNSAYWNGTSYLGIGPSAHSFDRTSRQWNVANNALYLKSIEERIIPAEIEILSPVQQLNEYIMTSLRTSDGLSLEMVEANWNIGQRNRLMELSEKYILSQKMINAGEYLILTDSGKLFADGISADLFCEE